MGPGPSHSTLGQCILSDSVAQFSGGVCETGLWCSISGPGSPPLPPCLSPRGEGNGGGGPGPRPQARAPFGGLGPGPEAGVEGTDTVPDLAVTGQGLESADVGMASVRLQRGSGLAGSSPDSMGIQEGEVGLGPHVVQAISAAPLATSSGGGGVPGGVAGGPSGEVATASSDVANGQGPAKRARLIGQRCFRW